MKALLEHMVQELVDHPDQVAIEEMKGDKVTTL